MNSSKLANTIFIKVVLWGILFYSAQALLYHTRWFIPYLSKGITYVVPNGQTPFIWFVVQICENIIFLIACYLLIRLFKKYQKTGFFDMESLRVFDSLIVSCIGLALLEAIQTISNNFAEIHFEEWTSAVSSINLLYRSFTRFLILRNPQPQTMYILLAIILWVVKQFVTKALSVKHENDSFI
jgi:hypothetical protein